MQRLLLLSLTLAAACNGTQRSVVENHALAAEETLYASTITEADLKTHLYIYASDEFEGRDTGSSGQKKAVEYLEDAYKAMGIAPARGESGYRQPVPIENSRVPQGQITLNGKTYSNGDTFLTFEAGSGDYSEIHYVGYGIDTENYSDYAGKELEGKFLLMHSGEPRNEDGTYAVTGTDSASAWGDPSDGVGLRQAAAKAYGAKGFFLVDDLNYSRYQRYFERQARSNRGRMALATPSDEPQMVLLRSELAEALYPGFGKPENAGSSEAEIRIQVENKSEPVDTENVVAFIRGTTYPDEYVIISSHLDHIGITQDGEINNGADDDGSGTVAVLEIAQAFKKAADEGNGPKRSIVFLHVTGEERGLLGSQYYTDFDPVFPLEQTVADLNIDMIGRIDPKRDGDRNYIYLIGSDKLSTELHELSEAVNDRFTRIELDYKYNDENDPNRFYYRSDHYNFAKNNIPIIFYFNGTHVDYHRPGDTPDKINYDLLRNRTQLVFYTAWEIANRDARIRADKAAP